MTPRDLLVSLVGRGAKLTARDGRIVIDDPTGVVTEADIADLTRLKPEVLALLAPNPAALADPAPTHREPLRRNFRRPDSCLTRLCQIDRFGPARATSQTGCGARETASPATCR